MNIKIKELSGNYQVSGIIVALVTLLFGAPTAHANLIDATYGAGAGSFELGSFVNNGSGYMSLSPGNNTTITGWTVGGPGNGIDWLTTPQFGASDGIHSIDLTKTIASSIVTTIPTITGAVYDLSFGAAAWVSGTSNSGLVSAGSLNQNFTTTLSASLAAQSFDPFLFQFTATGPLTTISFLSTNQNTGRFTYGPVIDKVSVDFVSGPETPSVPEPSLFALILIGLGAEMSRKILNIRKNSRI